MICPGLPILSSLEYINLLLWLHLEIGSDLLFTRSSSDVFLTEKFHIIIRQNLIDLRLPEFYRTNSLTKSVSYVNLACTKPPQRVDFSNLKKSFRVRVLTSRRFSCPAKFFKWEKKRSNDLQKGSNFLSSEKSAKLSSRKKSQNSKPQN